jgi:hypothetical protein
MIFQSARKNEDDCIDGAGFHAAGLPAGGFAV